MKIKNLTDEQRKQFKSNVPIFLQFFKQYKPLLSQCSHSLYARTLSFISIEQDMVDCEPKELAIKLSKELLTTTDFLRIVGDENGGNQNIRLSAFRNLIEPFKEDLQSEISGVSYDTVNKLISRKGTHIRKAILKNKNNNLKSHTETLNMKSWGDCQKVLENANSKHGVLLNRFFKTNEIPDYVGLRDILITNLYLNNWQYYQDEALPQCKNGKLSMPPQRLKVFTLLRNEYKTCHLWISGSAPPKDKNNYFWLNLVTNNHHIVIQKNKTTGGVRRIQGANAGETNVIEQTEHKRLHLSRSIVSMILFIKQTFNERCDVPFLKNNDRDGPITDGKWQRIIAGLFGEVSPNMNATVLRKILYNHIKFHEMSNNQVNFILEQQDHSRGVCETYYKKI